jgi:hypothetical protein
MCATNIAHRRLRLVEAIGHPQSKTGTRLITLGTGSGPLPKPHQAQSSNLLSVNGAHYIVDAGDGVTRRLAKHGGASVPIAQVFFGMMSAPEWFTRTQTLR